MSFARAAAHCLVVVAILASLAWLYLGTTGLAVFTEWAGLPYLRRKHVETLPPLPAGQLRPNESLLHPQEPDEVVTLERVQSLDKWALNHPWLFVRPGPCSNESALPSKQPIKMAVFVGDTKSGSFAMRGIQLAKAISFIPGWHGVATSKTHFATRQKKLLKDGGVAFCSFVRSYSPASTQLCHDNGALVYYDVLDNTKFSNMLIKKNGGRVPPGVDVVLSPTRHFAFVAETGTTDEILRDASGGWVRHRPIASLARHHVANPGVINDPMSILRPHICRIGLLAAAPNHVLRDVTLSVLKTAACKTGIVHRFTMFLQRVHTSDPHVVLHMDAVCKIEGDDAGGEEEQCQHLPPPVERHVQQLYEPSEMAVNGQDDCFGDQWKWHDDAVARSIDVGLIWQSGPHAQRPTTRFVYWCSHGVPVIIGNDEAAREVAKDHDYTLPNGMFPFVDTFKDVSDMILHLADPWARLRLRSRGYEIAAKYSVRGVAHRLVDIWEEHQ